MLCKIQRVYKYSEAPLQLERGLGNVIKLRNMMSW